MHVFSMLHTWRGLEPCPAQPPADWLQEHHALTGLTQVPTRKKKHFNLILAPDIHFPVRKKKHKFNTA